MYCRRRARYQARLRGAMVVLSAHGAGKTIPRWIHQGTALNCCSERLERYRWLEGSQVVACTSRSSIWCGQFQGQGTIRTGHIMDDQTLRPVNQIGWTDAGADNYIMCQ